MASITVACKAAEHFLNFLQLASQSANLDCSRGKKSKKLGLARDGYGCLEPNVLGKGENGVREGWA